MSIQLKTLRYKPLRSILWIGVIFFTAALASAQLVFTPTPAPPEPQLTLDELKMLVGQRLLIDVDSPLLSPDQEELIKHGWAGGVILYQKNVRSKEQVKSFVASLQAMSPVPLFVAVDQEGGMVTRLKAEMGFKAIPSEASLGRDGDPEHAYQFGVNIAEELKSVGANLDLAPVVDLDNKKADSIISVFQRSLGSNPNKVAELSKQIMLGMKSVGIIATAKHFPGETLARQDPHNEAAVADAGITEIWYQDLQPYRVLIQSGLEAIMISHVIYNAIDPKLPASLSSRVIQILLRKDMGFRGLTISDALNMQAVQDKYKGAEPSVMAAKAGIDVILPGGDREKMALDALVKAVQAGEIPLSSAFDSYSRIMRVKAELFAVK